MHSFWADCTPLGTPLAYIKIHVVDSYTAAVAQLKRREQHFFKSMADNISLSTRQRFSEFNFKSLLKVKTKAEGRNRSIKVHIPGQIANSLSLLKASNNQHPMLRFNSVTAVQTSLITWLDSYMEVLHQQYFSD